MLCEVDVDASGRGCSMRVAQYGVDGGGIGVEVMDSVNNALTDLSKIGGVYVVSIIFLGSISSGSYSFLANISMTIDRDGPACSGCGGK